MASLNAVAIADAVNVFQFYMTGLAAPQSQAAYRRYRPLRGDLILEEPRRAPDCPECGTTPGGRFAKGDSISLPTR